MFMQHRHYVSPHKVLKKQIKKWSERINLRHLFLTRYTISDKTKNAIDFTSLEQHCCTTCGHVI